MPECSASGAGGGERLAVFGMPRHDAGLELVADEANPLWVLLAGDIAAGGRIGYFAAK